MKVKRRLTGVGLLAALLVSCGDEQTALVLEARSELAIDALDEVVFRVRGAGLDGGLQEAIAPVSGANARSFPLTLVLVSGPGGGGPFTVVIEGRKGGAVRAQALPVRADAPIAFVPGEISRHAFVLRDGAVASGTPVPGTGTTPPPTMMPPGMNPPPMTMPPPMNPPPMMMPPPMNPPPMTMPPMGACAGGKQACSKGQPCACGGGCGCAFSCDDGASKCQAVCSGPGTTCRVDVGPAKGGDLKCHAGAQCTVDGSRGLFQDELNVECKAALCEVTCAPGEKGYCTLACKEQSRCLFRCAGEGCKLDCPGDAQRTCADGSQVCNRDCP